MRSRILTTVTASVLMSVSLVVAGLAGTASAMAAASPAVAIRATTGITQTTATLNGTVNPEGAATTYRFAWGPTTALGSFAPAVPASAGGGRTAAAASTTLAGLQPGTTYYFELQATNSAGTAATPVKALKTKGTPPPGPTTGAATGVGRYQATLTGTIVPNEAATTYYFQYGLTAAYGMQTAPQTLAPGTSAVSVTSVLPGLQPGVTFHYRLVATHTAAIAAYGADQTFETLPFPPPRAHLTATVRPRRQARRPFHFSVHGEIGIPAGTPAAQACTGSVRIAVMDGTRRLARLLTPLRPDCSFATATGIHRLPAWQRRAHTVRLRFGIEYLGNTYVGRSIVIHGVAFLRPRLSVRR